MAMSILYCGNFMDTLETAERFHNLNTSRFFAFLGISWLIIGLIIGLNWLLNTLELLLILFSAN